MMGYSHWDKLPTIHLHCNTSIPEIILDTEWDAMTEWDWSILMESIKTDIRRLVLVFFKFLRFCHWAFQRRRSYHDPVLPSCMITDHTHTQGPDAPPSHRPNAFPTSLTAGGKGRILICKCYPRATADMTRNMFKMQHFTHENSISPRNNEQ